MTAPLYIFSIEIKMFSLIPIAWGIILVGIYVFLRGFEVHQI